MIRIKYLNLNLLLFFLTVFSNDNTTEQIAFDYFATEILSKNYPKVNKVYFPGQSEAEESIAGPFSQCFESNNDFSRFYYQHKKVLSEKVFIDFTDFTKFRKSIKSKANNLNLRIYRAVNKKETSYVYIKVFRENHFVDHYLMKISSDGAGVVDVCHVNEII